ncbi:aminotransferase class V-fold PLP-dependent enzyme [Staphylococcus croceilyticus]|uniref:Aminotransferase class V-fold PLP-dependent enzyme n=1 Tax=Staphylococcus croceilyticus TaxID=319942 RepID=A0ABY2KAP1_9STAP|nr:aminotransferase class V-fold PLP-dependent enzyme [Staphylococcus croceilyticus]PNZ69729.1 lysine decarboxylase [Staphylococcus croceilyticus]TGA73890.1 aminotransferase class V-fold PLP-dependent enzyme [Staphylococcus croceilyticus]
MNTPITQKLNELIDHKAISLHVPGHKNMTIGQLNKLKFEMDMTEITGLDDLHHPEEIILESMHSIKKHRDYEAYMLVNGTTSGILSVIQAFSSNEGNYLISRNVHKSVFHGIDLTQQNADIMPMRISDISHQYIAPDLTQAHFDKQKLAILTYPNYYGECFDIKETVATLHQHDIPVLVDEAHGAHFNLPHFPKSALEVGADYVVQSYHKTLPALTMGSVLYIHKDAPMKEEVIRYLGYFQTSSPSYLVMTSIELAHQFFKDYDSTLFFEKRNLLLQALEKTGFEVIKVADPLKVLIRYPGYSGHEIQTWFEAQHIYPELADEYQVLLVLPLWHQQDTYPYTDLLERIRAIDLPAKLTTVDDAFPLPVNEGIYISRTITSVTWIDIDQAINKVLAKHIIPYPPGIPIFLKGERITQNMIKLMRYYLQQGGRVEGINNDKILVKDE